jgi:cardiolipin synthase
MMRVKIVAIIEMVGDRPSYDPPVATAPEDKGFFTVPNLISVVRLGCIPLFLVLLFHRHDRLGAATLLAVLGATDWVDGWIARRFDQVSEIGKILDPTADRLLFIVGIVAILIDRSAPLWFGIVVLAREIGVGGTMATATAMGMKRIDVTWFGKCGTFGLMFTFPMFLLSKALGHSQWSHFWWWAAWSTGLPALVFSFLAAGEYAPRIRSGLAEARAVRTA